MKRIILITICFTLSFIACAPKKDNEADKVADFISEVDNLIKNNPRDFYEKTEEIKEIILSLNLNEANYLAVLDTIEHEIDIENISYHPEDIKDLETHRLFQIYLLAVFRLKTGWKESLSHEDIIMTKVLPLITSKVNTEKTTWMIDVLRDLLNEIYNNRLPFSDENIQTVKNNLINIGSDRKSSLNTREVTDRALKMLGKIEEKYKQ